MKIKAKNVRCHVGAQIGAEVHTSLDSEVHGIDMTCTEHGVFLDGSVKGVKLKEPYFIYGSTIASVRLDRESYEESTKEKPARK